MVRAIQRVGLSVALLLALTGCGEQALYIGDLAAQPDPHNGKAVTVEGVSVSRDNQSVLALGVSTLDNGLDAQALGEPIWLEGFPAEAARELHNPGDAVYGSVRVRGTFESGAGYGPEGRFKHQITVASAEPIERVVRVEQRAPRTALGEGKVSFYDLTANPAAYQGQTITTRGYYFWNSVIFVLAEGVSTEEDGSNPQPVGKTIWMEGFPPDLSGQLNVGPNNSFVWGYVEVSGPFQAEGAFGKDGRYTEFLQVTAASIPAQK
jgi:hypothetical protein